MSWATHDVSVVHLPCEQYKVNGCGESDTEFARRADADVGGLQRHCDAALLPSDREAWPVSKAVGAKGRR